MGCNIGCNIYILLIINRIEVNVTDVTSVTPKHQLRIFLKKFRKCGHSFYYPILKKDHFRINVYSFCGRVWPTFTPR